MIKEKYRVEKVYMSVIGPFYVVFKGDEKVGTYRLECSALHQAARLNNLDMQENALKVESCSDFIHRLSYCYTDAIATFRIYEEVVKFVSKDIKYIVVSGYVHSKNDHDRHFISCDQLIRLYGANPKECECVRVSVYEVDKYHLRDLEQRYPDAKVLFPDYTGKYEIPV